MITANAFFLLLSIKITSGLTMGSLPLDLSKHLHPKTFTEESKAVVDFIADYYRNIENYPVRSTVEPGYLRLRLADSAPYFPQSLESILEDVQKDIIPGLTHWQSPNFYGYFPCNASTAGFLGEMLGTGFNVVGFSWFASPAMTELENVVMDWMGKMLELPRTFLFEGGQGGGGVLHGTTCEAVLCTLAAARDRALEKLGAEGITKLVVYASDQTHSTVQKASKLVGIPPSNFRSIPTTTSTGYALSSESVRLAMEADIKNGLVPVYLCATVGTTALNAVDPLVELGQLANSYNVWIHIDAAYAGSAAICPEFRHYLDGVELADSISMNAHKWLLTNMDCCCLWVKNSAPLVESLSINPEYLRNRASDAHQVVDYKDWQMALSRPSRAIKLWVILRRFGVANLIHHIRSDVQMAEKFERMVKADKRFEVVVPRRFSLVCFRLTGVPDDRNRELLNAINGSGRAFLTHATAQGMVVLRLAVGTTLTEERHVDATWALIQEKATEILRTPRSMSQVSC